MGSENPKRSALHLKSREVVRSLFDPDPIVRPWLSVDVLPTPPAGGPLKSYIQLGLLLAAVWLLWSFHFTPLLLTFGALSILLVLWIVARMRIVDREANLGDLQNVGILLYLPWILWEIVKANLDVSRVILDPKLPIAPRMIRVDASQRSPLGKVIYANSITLTPGTVTVDVDEEDSTILVHALTSTAYQSLMTGEMDRRVRALEKPT